jgi:hypothetical protein
MADSLLVECPLTRRIWEKVATLPAVPTLNPATWDAHHRVVDWLGCLAAGLPNAEASRVRSWAMLVLWHIWLERNARTFRASTSTLESLIAKIADEAAAWDRAGGGEDLLTSRVVA